MRSLQNALLLLPILITTSILASPSIEQPAAAFPDFEMEEIDRGLKVGYAVLLEDVDDDGKKDIIVVDTIRVVWYQNPTWQKRVIMENQTKPDNVCIAAHDIDRDGKLDFALGADWGRLNTRSGGTLQWLKRGDSLDEKWQVFPIATEPTIHRIRFADIDGGGKQELLVVPLMGRNSTAAKNWMDGEPVRILAFRIPAQPEKERWPVEVLDQSLHVVHNFWPIPADDGKRMDVLAASYEGVTLITRSDAGKWNVRRLGNGNQEQPNSRRGASEIKQGELTGNHKFIATIEPWHGNQVVVYTAPKAKDAMWDRHVIDEHLRWGHAVLCADLDGNAGDELIIGVRDDPQKGDDFNERRGVRIYKALTADGAKWSRKIIDNGGVAVEDMAVGDLNGDGRADLVAVGRQTGNVRIYWNKGPKGNTGN